MAKKRERPRETLMVCPEADQRLKLSMLASVGVVAGILMGWALGFGGQAWANHNSLRSQAVRIYSGDTRGHTNTGTGLQQGEYNGGEPRPPCFYNYGATVWYRFVAPKYGTVTLRVIAGAESVGNGDNFIDTNVALFRRSKIRRPLSGTTSSEPRIACNDEDPRSDSRFDSGLHDIFVGPRTYGIQVGGILYGSMYDQGFFQLSLDFDRAPWLVAILENGWTLKRKGAKIDELKLTRAPRRSKARIRCRGDCNGIKRVEGDPLPLGRDGKLNLKKKFRKNRLLDAGTKLNIRVTKRRQYGRGWKIKIRGGERGPKITGPRRLKPAGGR
jgi:hypothetical protein